MTQKSAVIVLGMHRSGTSAMTRVLNLLGLELNREVIAPATDNTTGFWEANRVVDINDEILKRFNSSWDNFLPISEDFLLSKQLDDLRIDAKTLLTEDFNNCTLWVLKDPRLSRTLSFWVPLIESLGHELKIVNMVRHPLEVIESLVARNQFSKANHNNAAFSFENWFLATKDSITSSG